MHVSLPPSAYIMKVQMPRLKEDPNSQAEDSEMRSATSENADANLEEDDDDEASDDAKAVGSTRFRMARRHEAAELTEEEAREAQEAQTQRYQAQVDSLVEERLVGKGNKTHTKQQHDNSQELPLFVLWLYGLEFGMPNNKLRSRVLVLLPFSFHFGLLGALLSFPFFL